MPSPSAMLALPASILALVAQVSAKDTFPTAIKKISPGSGEKIFANHLAFAPLPVLAPHEAASAALVFLDQQDEELAHQSNTSIARFRPAFQRHYEEAEGNVLRRAAEVLALLERRQACPSGMNSCSDVGAPNKCCQEGTYCTDVSDTNVGKVACCPEGATCDGSVGDCPTEARSCPAELGGGCCIPGYVCQGVGCIPSASATPEPTTGTSAEGNSPTTITTTSTTWIEGNPSTVVVTLIVTESESAEPETLTTTEHVTVSSTGHATGGAPWRPTGTSSMTTASETSDDSDTQTGCPTGFYGCLARHGGGCCQTDRDCNTHSCPTQSLTTIISDGATIVVAATDVPTTSATATCADGWFMCGKEAGPVAGCCPSGYDCGTASCYTSEASQTAQVQKELPESTAAEARASWLLLGGITGAWLLACLS